MDLVWGLKIVKVTRLDDNWICELSVSKTSEILLNFLKPAALFYAMRNLEPIYPNFKNQFPFPEQVNKQLSITKCALIL